jgi:hypothetical protein
MGEQELKIIKNEFRKELKVRLTSFHPVTGSQFSWLN